MYHTLLLVFFFFYIFDQFSASMKTIISDNGTRITRTFVLLYFMKKTSFIKGVLLEFFNRMVELKGNIGDTAREQRLHANLPIDFLGDLYHDPLI